MPAIGEKKMAMITLRGNPFSIAGELPEVGAAAPDFALTNADLEEKNKSDFGGKTIVLSIFPSIDTPVCATAARQFNEKASVLQDAVVLCVSHDLPFALGRFCGAEGLDNVIPLSAFRHPEFGKAYGVTVADGPLAGLLARAVVVIGKDGKIAYTELVPEIAQEPDYDAALRAIG